LALVLPISKRHQKDKAYFDEHGGNVKRLSPKTVHTIFSSGICYLLKLLNGFKNTARKPASCYIEKFPVYSEKNLLDLAAKQLKWQHYSTLTASCVC